MEEKTSPVDKWQTSHYSWGFNHPFGEASTQVCQVPADEGDVTIFAANSAAVQGQDFKHGVIWRETLRSWDMDVSAVVPPNSWMVFVGENRIQMDDD